MNQEIKVTNCSECPMFETTDEYGNYSYYCSQGTFEDIFMYDEIEGLRKHIHHNCPLKGQSITFKIEYNENTTQIHK